LVPLRSDLLCLDGLTKDRGAKITKMFPDIQVTTKHTYEIEYKFMYTCSNASCAVDFGRQKKIDLDRLFCGACKSRLCQTKPAPKEGKENKRANPFGMFVKEYFMGVKRKNPGCSHKEIMTTLSRMYREQKGNNKEGTLMGNEESDVNENDEDYGELLGSVATLDIQ
jgi:hypothetical protein